MHSSHFGQYTGVEYVQCGNNKFINDNQGSCFYEKGTRPRFVPLEVLLEYCYQYLFKIPSSVIKQRSSILYYTDEITFNINIYAAVSLITQMVFSCIQRNAHFRSFFTSPCLFYKFSCINIRRLLKTGTSQSTINMKSP